MASLQGMVVEASSGQGIPGVRVSANGSDGYTDGDGFFIVSGLTPGRNFVVSISHPNFSSYSTRYALATDTDYSLGTIRLRQTRVSAL